MLDEFPLIKEFSHLVFQNRSNRFTLTDNREQIKLELQKLANWLDSDDLDDDDDLEDDLDYGDDDDYEERPQSYEDGLRDEYGDEAGTAYWNHE